MSMFGGVKMEKKKKYHRGRRKKKTKGQLVRRAVSTLVLIVAIGVFCFSAFQLYQIFYGYHEGEKEYEDIVGMAVIENETGDEFEVNFDALKEVNSDVVGWIRFIEPSIINYPVVQGRDNDKYLHKTFKGYDNTVGSIFVNAYNNADFNDQNTIIYGHYMYNGTMFNDLDKYKDQEFWERYPFFYIYTPDGKELRYDIYSAGIVKDTSGSYTYQFADETSFAKFIELTKSVSNYDTGVEVGLDAQVITLSTCTKDNNDDRFVIHAVKAAEREVKNESN